MPASWPAAPFPQVFEAEGFIEEESDNINVFQPRSGPPKTRPTILDPFRFVHGNITIDSVGKVTFETFYFTTINSGQDKFNAQLASADGTVELYMFDPRRPVPFDLSQEGDNIILSLDLMIVPQ